MAELVDAPSSGGGGGNPVEVRVLFWAPFVLLTFSQMIYKTRRNPRDLALGSFRNVPPVLGGSRHFCGPSAGLCETTLGKGPHMPLTETRLRALKAKDKPYKVADQRGLYVEVTPAGGKLWRFRYRIGKIEKKLSIGSYPEVSLKQARDATYEARQAVASARLPRAPSARARFHPRSRQAPCCRAR